MHLQHNCFIFYNICVLIVALQVTLVLLRYCLQYHIMISKNKTIDCCSLFLLHVFHDVTLLHVHAFAAYCFMFYSIYVLCTDNIAPQVTLVLLRHKLN